MISYKLDTDLDVIPIDAGDGLLTLQTSSYPETNNQLVPLRIFTPKELKEFEPRDAINWKLFFGEQLNKIDESRLNVFATQLRTLIKNTQGVDTVSFEDAKIEVKPTLSISGVCWTTGCNKYYL